MSQYRFLFKSLPERLSIKKQKCYLVILLSLEMVCSDILLSKTDYGVLIVLAYTI